MSNDGEVIGLYVIYRSPSDYPGKVVVRRQAVHRCGYGMVIMPDDEPLSVSDTVDEARQSIPDGLVNVGRQDEDDPVIAEVWI